MKIIYDKHEESYLIELEYPETVTWINTKDIVEARKEFIERMTWLFNTTICEKLKD